MERKIDIQVGHTYSDYRRYFGYEFDKGKLLAFLPSQIKYMNPTRQYWELKDEDGITKYFELPDHVKPFTVFSPYCFNRIFHRRPARTAMLIAGSVIVASITCSFVGKKFFGQKDFDIDVNVSKLDEAAINYKRWRATHEGEDISNKFEVYTLANFAMGQTLYDADVNKATLKNKVMTIGHGQSDTNIMITHVLVNISNCFIQNQDKALEESISYGTMSLTRFGKRDFYNDIGNKEISAYHGEASSSTTCKWENEPSKIYPNKDDYEAVAGKCPYQPFLYNITKETVLTDKVFDENPTTGEKHFGESKCTAIKDKNNKITGYKIDMDLHNVKGVTRYVKRMTYLSGQTPDYFETVHLTYETDADLRLVYSEVHENYHVTLMPSSGWFKTKYYYEDSDIKPLTIPNKSECVDYSKYPF